MKHSKHSKCTNVKWIKLPSFLSDLAGENRSMKNYIDRLMMILMEKFPEVLENLGSSV